MFTTQSALAAPLLPGESDRLLVTQTTDGNTLTLVDTRDLGTANPFLEGGAETFTLTPAPGIAVFVPNLSFGLLESDGTTPSDIITTSADGTSITFTSDIEGQPLTVPPGTVSLGIEDPNNAVVLPSSIFSDLAPSGVQISFQSDGDGAAPIPEPATVALFGLGLGVLWVVDRKRRRS